MTEVSIIHKDSQPLFRCMEILSVIEARPSVQAVSSLHTDQTRPFGIMPSGHSVTSRRGLRLLVQSAQGVRAQNGSLGHPCICNLRHVSSSSVARSISFAPSAASTSYSSPASASFSSTSQAQASTSSSPTSPQPNATTTPVASTRGPASPKWQSRTRLTDLALGIAGTLGFSALIFYNLKSTNESGGQMSSFTTMSAKTFTLPIPTKTGVDLRTITMISKRAVDEKLKENERSFGVARPGNPLYRYDTNSVASNPICEDAAAFTILEHEGKDWILASVFDGHSGHATSRLMAVQLEKYIGRELMQVFKGGYRSLSIAGESWWNALLNPSKDKTSAALSAKLDERIHLIPEALRNAYLQADKDICQPPLDYLKSLENPSSLAKLTEEQRKHGMDLLMPALSGSCSISTLIDTSESQAYVALAGDSRAVMGTYHPETGKWSCQVLSEDQTGRNPKEVARMRKEHPKNESEQVIMRGRVLGGLEPTRSFGDAKYKYPVGMQEKLIRTFSPSSRWSAPALYQTPPYVTADPEVSVFPLSTQNNDIHKQAVSSSPPALSSNTSESATSPSIGKRFIVLATDGLYDCLSSEEVVALVAARLDGVKGTKSGTEILGRLGTSDQSTSAFKSHTPSGSEGSDQQASSKRKFTFEDDNLCTHLIRNALGGANSEQVSGLLSIPAPLSRRYRDDVSADECAGRST